jgi:hypothetical protein
MHKIQKTISLDTYKAKVPLIYPSIKDGKINYIDKSSISENKNANYGLIPLLVNEAICGGYSSFTESMANVYSEKTLSYNTLKEWYDEFNSYYDLLYSNVCKKVYANAIEYYDDLLSNSFEDKNEYETLDATFNEHGGSLFYKWLNDCYFGLLDLRHEYNEAITFYTNSPFHISRTINEWIECIDKLDCNKYYYPDAIALYAKVYLLYKRFGNNTEITNQEDCCDFEYYKSIGGYDLYLILKQWIDKISSKIDTINSYVKSEWENLIPNLSIITNLQQKVEDLGDYSIFSIDFIPGREYTKGNVCTYDDNVYILTGSTSGYKKSDDSDEIIIDLKQWAKYSSYYFNNNPSEQNKYSNDYKLTGTTRSYLEEFKRNVPFVDLMGNEMPGYYEYHQSDSIFSPPEGALLDLPYRVGDYVRETLDDSDNNIYRGNVLYQANVYLKDTSGNTIEDTIIEILQNDGVSSHDSEIEENIEDYSDMYDGNLYIDFMYYKGCLFTVDTSGNVHVKKADNSDYYTGIKYIETCTLTKKNCSYYTSNDSKYPLKYYELDYVNKEEFYFKTVGINKEIPLATWYMNPSSFDSNDEVVAPAFRKEELLGFTSPEILKTPENGIYINRGYLTALDKHIRIGEISSIETLESYGNGLFTMLNKETESSL